MKLPAPTMRMRRETMKAAEQENAIPRWADRRSLVMVMVIVMVLSNMSVDDVNEAPASGHAAAQEKVETNCSCAHQAGDQNWSGSPTHY